MESHGIPMEFVDFQLEKNLAANQKQKQGMSKTEADDARHKVGRIQMLSEVEDFFLPRKRLSFGRVLFIFWHNRFNLQLCPFFVFPAAKVSREAAGAAAAASWCW